MKSELLLLVFHHHYYVYLLLLIEIHLINLELEQGKKQGEETIKHHERKPWKHFNDDDDVEDHDDNDDDNDADDDGYDVDDDDDFDGTTSVQIRRPTVGVCPPPL